ncbi:tumor necrosis factor receptor superfamily member 1B [Trachinotus anak]|uniref:tumor necrosis factor receptor superfamily member 1B n=1 Tax=Trachinotus anak TaxID=443729 RepID=UPI0039F1B500
MKEILVLLVLLSAQTSKVCSQPYKVDSDGRCRNSTSEYMPEGTKRCCKKCRPGERLIETCTETTDTVCKPCERDQHMEGWNFANNCFACEKCKSKKGLQHAQHCSPTTKARCKCMPGMYCMMGFDDLHCTECRKYSLCKAGYGVSVPGTAKSDVKCEQCPDGTFSDKNSNTDRCQPHTNCHGSAVVRKGNTTSDNVCEHHDVTTAQLQNTTQERDVGNVFTTTSTTRSRVLVISDFTPPVLKELYHSTKSPIPHTEPDIKLAAVIASIAGLILFFITIILVCFYKRVCKTGTGQFHPKVDANGNCESGDKLNQGYLGETQMTPVKVYSVEQQCLLGKGEAYSDHSQSSTNTETSTRTDGCSSHESIGPLQSTIALNNSYSALSEPMTLISNAEPVTPLPSVPSQPSSQPTSPQIISPVTSSPHVNVNITFHIGNGSCGTPSVMPTNLKETDCELPFGEEEGSFSVPQQEDGKQSLMSVQDSASYSV